MSVWTFLDFVERSGRNPFYEWLSGCPEEAQAVIDERILTMAGMERWPEGWISNYRSVTGVCEIRISCNRVKYRPLGMYATTERRAFVLLCGTIEKGGMIPKGDLKAAARRRNDLLVEPHRVEPHRFAT